MELECLGVVYAIQKCAFYIIGVPKPFTVVTVNKTLLWVFNKPLSETPNPRLQRLRLRVVGANVQLVWKGGGTNLIADAHLRSPISAPAPLDVDEQLEEAVFVRALETGSIEAANWMFQTATEDQDHQLMPYAHGKGKAVRNLSPSYPAHSYRACGTSSASARDPANSCCGSILDGVRIVVLVLKLLHLPHTGVVKTQQAGRHLYYWPGLSAAVPSKPLVVAQSARPIGAVGLDLCHAVRTELLHYGRPLL